MKTEQDSYDYDAGLEPIAVRFAEQVEWALPLPMMLRWWIGKYIEGLPDAFGASCFIARNENHPVAKRVRAGYKAAFGREYSAVDGGYSELHVNRVKDPLCSL